jgi:hypothetical protein
VSLDEHHEGTDDTRTKVCDRQFQTVRPFQFCCGCIETPGHDVQAQFYETALRQFA